MIIRGSVKTACERFHDQSGQGWFAMKGVLQLLDDSLQSVHGDELVVTSYLRPAMTHQHGISADVTSKRESSRSNKLSLNPYFNLRTYWDAPVRVFADRLNEEGILGTMKLLFMVEDDHIHIMIIPAESPALEGAVIYAEKLDDSGKPYRNRGDFSSLLQKYKNKCKRSLLGCGL